MYYCSFSCFFCDYTDDTYYDTDDVYKQIQNSSYLFWEYTFPAVIIHIINKKIGHFIQLSLIFYTPVYRIVRFGTGRTLVFWKTNIRM
jgi:hypothetical protein